MENDLATIKWKKESSFVLTEFFELEDSPCGPEGFELELGCEELG